MTSTSSATSRPARSTWSTGAMTATTASSSRASRHGSLAFWRRQKAVPQQLADGTDLLSWETKLDAPDSMFSGTLDVLHGGRPKRWDIVVTAAAPLLTGDGVHFVALPDGALIVEETVAHGSLDPLAGALEQQLLPPYRAEGVRRGAVWAVAANRIEVLELGDDAAGDALELA